MTRVEVRMMITDGKPSAKPMSEVGLGPTSFYFRGGTSRMKEQTSFNHFVIIISRNLYSFLLLSMEE